MYPTITSFAPRCASNNPTVYFLRSTPFLFKTRSSLKSILICLLIFFHSFCNAVFAQQTASEKMAHFTGFHQEEGGYEGIKHYKGRGLNDKVLLVDLAKINVSDWDTQVQYPSFENKRFKQHRIITTLSEILPKTYYGHWLNVGSTWFGNAFKENNNSFFGMAPKLSEIVVQTAYEFQDMLLGKVIYNDKSQYQNFLISNHSYGRDFNFILNIDNPAYSLNWRGLNVTSLSDLNAKRGLNPNFKITYYKNASYSELTNKIDLFARKYPNLLMVFTSGNNQIADKKSLEKIAQSQGQEDYIDFKVNPATNLTDRDKTEKFAINDLLGANFFRLNIDSEMKNALTVGAIEISKINKISLAPYSQVGPTGDGRIKPDICGIGNAVNYYDATGDHTGTSYAAPNVSAALTLMQEAYSTSMLDNIYMSAALAKAVAIHTAWQATGNGGGPNYKSGYGLVQVNKGVDLIEEARKYTPQVALTSEVLAKEGKGSVLLDQLEIGRSGFNLQPKLYAKPKPDGRTAYPMKATLCWTDKEGIVSTRKVSLQQNPDGSYQLDPSTLINDFDLQLFLYRKLKNGEELMDGFNPWQLDPRHPDRLAIASDAPGRTSPDRLNNVEQILLNSPTLPDPKYDKDGKLETYYFYRLKVINRRNIGSTEKFSLVITGLGPAPEEENEEAKAHKTKFRLSISEKKGVKNSQMDDSDGDSGGDYDDDVNENGNANDSKLPTYFHSKKATLYYKFGSGIDVKLTATRTAGDKLTIKSSIFWNDIDYINANFISTPLPDLETVSGVEKTFKVGNIASKDLASDMHGLVKMETYNAQGVLLQTDLYPLRYKLPETNLSVIKIDVPTPFIIGSGLMKNQIAVTIKNTGNFPYVFNSNKDNLKLNVSSIQPEGSTQPTQLFSSVVVYLSGKMEYNRLAVGDQYTAYFTVLTDPLNTLVANTTYSLSASLSAANDKTYVVDNELMQDLTTSSLDHPITAFPIQLCTAASATATEKNLKIGTTGLASGEALFFTDQNGQPLLKGALFQRTKEDEATEVTMPASTNEIYAHTKWQDWILLNPATDESNNQALVYNTGLFNSSYIGITTRALSASIGQLYLPNIITVNKEGRPTGKAIAATLTHYKNGKAITTVHTLIYAEKTEYEGEKFSINKKATLSPALSLEKETMYELSFSGANGDRISFVQTASKKIVEYKLPNSLNSKALVNISILNDGPSVQALDVSFGSLYDNVIEVPVPRYELEATKKATNVEMEIDLSKIGTIGKPIPWSKKIVTQNGRGVVKQIKFGSQYFSGRGLNEGSTPTPIKEYAGNSIPVSEITNDLYVQCITYPDGAAAYSEPYIFSAQNISIDSITVKAACPSNKLLLTASISSDNLAAIADFSLQGKVDYLGKRYTILKKKMGAVSSLGVQHLSLETEAGAFVETSTTATAKVELTSSYDGLGGIVFDSTIVFSATSVLASNCKVSEAGTTGIIESVTANLGTFSPHHVAVDTVGNIYFSDPNNNSINRIDAQSGIVSTVMGLRPYTGIRYTSSYTNHPTGIRLDKQGNLFVADCNNHRIWKITNPSNIVVDKSSLLAPRNFSIVAGAGVSGFSGDGGLAINAKFNQPQDLCFDVQGNMFIADAGNNLIRKVDAVTGKITTVVGSGFKGYKDANYSGDGLDAQKINLYYPSGVVVDAKGNIYIADYNTNRVRKIDGTTNKSVSIAGTGFRGFNGDQPNATNALLDEPFSIALDKNNTVYFSDANNNQVVKINADGSLSTVAGIGTKSFSGDGGPANRAKLNYPVGICFDKNGALYIADYGNSRIRKIGARKPSTLHFEGMPVTTKMVGDGVFMYTKALSAQTDLSSYPMVYSSSKPDVATVLPNGLMYIKSTGATTITVTQAGDDIYNAGRITAVLTVLQKSVIDLNLTPSSTNDPDFDPAAISNNLSTPINYRSSNVSIATIVNNKIHILKAGSLDITATQDAGGNYSAADPVMSKLIIGDPGSVKFYFPPIAPKIYGDVFELPATLNGKAITYSSSSRIISIAGNTVSANGVGGHYTITATANDGSGSVTRNLVVNRKVLVLHLKPTTFSTIYNGTTNIALEKGVAVDTALLALYSFDPLPKGVELFFYKSKVRYLTKDVGTQKMVIVSGISPIAAGTKGGNYSILADSVLHTGIITPKAIVPNIKLISKPYDGETTVNKNTRIQYSWDASASGDDVQLQYASGNFASKTIGKAKLVSLTGLALSGADQQNYSLSWTGISGLAVGEIVPQILTLNLQGNITKTYDGTATVVLSAENYNSDLQGTIVMGEQVGLSTTGKVIAGFTNKLVGTQKLVTASGFSLAGADSANYVLAPVQSNMGSIIAKTLNWNLSAVSKQYDATDKVIKEGLVYGFDNVLTIEGKKDDVLIDYKSGSYLAEALNLGKDVGKNKPVQFEGLSLLGADAGNYRLLVQTLKANAGIITPFALSKVVAEKVYNASRLATAEETKYTLPDLFSGDAVLLKIEAGLYDKASVGTMGITLQGLSISGKDLKNYTLSTTLQSGVSSGKLMGTGIITPKLLSATLIADGKTKVWDSRQWQITGYTKGLLRMVPVWEWVNIYVVSNRIIKQFDRWNAKAFLNPFNFELSGGILNKEEVLANATAGTYDNGWAGTNKLVTATGVYLFGKDAGNYALSSTQISNNIGEITLLEVQQFYAPNARVLTPAATLPGAMLQPSLIIEKLDVDGLYPNPTRGRFVVSCSKALNNATLRILDASGKTVHQQKASGNKVEIDIANQVAGIYYVEITENGHSRIKKLMKQ